MPNLTRHHRASGFSLVEVVVTLAMLGMTGLVGASVMNLVATADKTAKAQLSNAELARAIRQQLSRKASVDPNAACDKNLVTKPAAYSGTAPVAVRLATGGPVVQAGTSLDAWRLNVQGLELRNITPAGTADDGNAIFLGDLFLVSQGQDTNPNARPQLRETAVARLTMEVQGGTTLVACFANDVAKDTSVAAPMSDLCSMITSPSGQIATWDGAHCVTPDSPPPVTCAAMGGAYNAGACAFHSETFVVSKTIPPGSPGGGVGYSIGCPGGTTTVAGTCSAVGYYDTPYSTILLYGAMGGNGVFTCEWLPGDYPGGNESVPYNLYAVCLK